LVSRCVDGEPEQRELLGAVALPLGRVQHEPEPLVQLGYKPKALGCVRLAHRPRPRWGGLMVVHIHDERESRLPQVLDDPTHFLISCPWGDRQTVWHGQRLEYPAVYRERKVGTDGWVDVHEVVRVLDAPRDEARGMSAAMNSAMASYLKFISLRHALTCCRSMTKRGLSGRAQITNAGDTHGADTLSSSVSCLMNPAASQWSTSSFTKELSLHLKKKHYCYPPKNGGCREKGGRADDIA